MQDINRKLIAILSADVKGYSRLMGDDEVATLKTLTAYFQAITDLVQRHKGRVVNTAGDSLLVEFGSVVDALQCAVGIQSELKARNTELSENRRMELRIGINLGDVIEEGDTIYGDGVNIAARVQSLAEAGGICISGTAYDHVKKKVPLVYESLGEEMVKNIADPVRVYRILMEPGVKKVATEKGALPLPDKPSIAVLPFINMSGDPGQEFFSDGMTEEIITALSKSPYLFVIARTSTFTYKGKPTDVKRVSEELGVRYVLEGSVRRSGERVRITAQLIDALTGYHLWAERYDRDIRDIFAIQDEITLKIMETVHVKLQTMGTAGETGKGAGNLEAFLKAMEAREHYHLFTKEHNAIARKLFEEAIALDRDYAFPYFGLAGTHVADVWVGASKSPKESVELAIGLGEKALTLGASGATIYAYLGYFYVMARQFEKAVDLAEKALAFGQDSSEVLFHAGTVMAYSGKPEEAIPLLQKSIRLNPFAPSQYFTVFAAAYRMAGHYGEALEQAKKAVERNPNNLVAHIGLTVASILAGCEQEARAAAADVLRIDPNFSVEQFGKVYPLKDRSQADLAIDALRKAGLR
jgi:adenylate cyclase